MAKTTVTYWNPLSAENRARWKPVEGLEGIADELTLSIDESTGEYTRLTRFNPGADTTAFGGKSHTYGPFKTDTGCVVLELSFPARGAA